VAGLNFEHLADDSQFNESHLHEGQSRRLLVGRNSAKKTYNLMMMKKFVVCLEFGTRNSVVQ